MCYNLVFLLLVVWLVSFFFQRLSKCLQAHGFDVIDIVSANVVNIVQVMNFKSLVDLFMLVE
jgi:hypothetical protein